MIEAEDVAAYLESHPDFFDRHPDLLEHLHVPHVAGSAAISLVERQVKLLRDKQAANRERLAELVRVARSNDLLAERVHALSLRLLQARTLADVESQVLLSIREEFDVNPARLFLAPSAAATVLSESSSLLSAGKPRCGHFGDAQKTLFFGDAGRDLRSLALVPLGPGAALGVLALGSTDPDRFPPGLSTDFLTRVGELIAAIVRRCSTPSVA